MNHTEFEWVSPNDVRFFAQEWLPDGQITASVTVVHGLGEHSSRYNHMAEYFCKNGISVLSFDLRGHGRTEGKRGFIPSYGTAVEDIKHFIFENRSRHPNIPHYLYGHSLGGALALYYCFLHNDSIDGVITTGPVLAPGDPVPPVKLFLAKALASIAPSFTMANGLDINNLSRDAAVVHRYKSDPLVHSMVSASLGNDLLEKGAWMLANATTFDVPLLLMYGSGDHVVSVPAIKQFAGSLNNQLNVKEWVGFYHEIHNEEEQETVFQYTIDWINGKRT